MKYLVAGFLLIFWIIFSAAVYAAPAAEVTADFAMACDLAGHAELERKQAIKRIVRQGSNNEDYFISMLHSNKTIQRQIAAEVLGGLGGKKSETALIMALENKDVFLQGAAARALAVLYSRLPQIELCRALRSDPAEMVELAVLYGAYKRARYGHERLSPELTQSVGALLSKVADNRRIQAAVMVLRYTDTQEGVLTLLKVAGNTRDSAVQIEVCRALAAIAPEGKAPQIETLSLCGNPRVEIEAWNALGAMGYAEVDKAMAVLATSPDPAVQARALASLAKFGNRYDPLFISALKSVDPEVRFQALCALEKTAAVFAAAEVAELMGPQGDVNPVVRARAALVFARLTNSGGLTPLLKDSRNTEKKMLPFRLEAIRALGELGDKGALRDLLDFLLDADLTVRITAVRSLAQLGDQRALPQLRHMLTLRKGEERLVIQEAISELEG